MFRQRQKAHGPHARHLLPLSVVTVPQWHDGSDWGLGRACRERVAPVDRRAVGGRPACGRADMASGRAGMRAGGPMGPVARSPEIKFLLQFRPLPCGAHLLGAVWAQPVRGFGPSGLGKRSQAAPDSAWLAPDAKFVHACKFDTSSRRPVA
jgi:hypothetical protein